MTVWLSELKYFTSEIFHLVLDNNFKTVAVYSSKITYCNKDFVMSYAFKFSLYVSSSKLYSKYTARYSAFLTSFKDSAYSTAS